MKKYIVILLLILASGIANASLVAYWKMDDNAASTVVIDETGNYDGVSSANTNTLSVNGKVGRAIDFNGTTDVITVGDNAVFTPNGTEFSVTAWINMDDATNFIIASKGVLGATGEWEFFVNGSDKLSFVINDESETAFIGRTTAAITSLQNTWIHVTGTYDGGTSNAGVNLYINGVLSNASTLALNVFANIDAGGADVLISKLSTNFAEGKVDDVRIYDHVLTQSEINSLVGGGRYGGIGRNHRRSRY